jgi:dihydrofolate reductase
MKNITMIAAVGKNLELGKDNHLLWRLPEDLKFFKEQTMGKPIIMGKKTLDSLPRLLPGRLHLVLTHQQLEETEQVKVFRDIDSLIDFIKTLDQEVMVIGGAQVYKQMLELSDKMILTEIDAETEADAYFPEFNKEEWEQEVLCSHEENGIKYKHLVYQKKR